MGFFPDVSPGAPFRPSAVLENNLRHMVNALNGFQTPSLGKTRGGAVKIQVYNSTTELITSGTGVNFDDSKKPSGDAIPAIPCSDASKPWGVIPENLKPNEMGDCIISGPVRVKISGAGSCAQPGKDPKIFERGESGAVVLYANEENGVILLGGGGGGSIAIGVLTSGPNNGYGPATWKAIVVNPDGTWTTTGQNIPVVVPAIK